VVRHVTAADMPLILKTIFFVTVTILNVVTVCPLHAKFEILLNSAVGILVDSEIVLSTRYGKTRVFINKTLSTETAYQQDLINRDLLSTRLIVGKVGPGTRCGKFNSTSNVLVSETQMKVNMYGCVSE
jgi:hypothetical protein